MMHVAYINLIKSSVNGWLNSGPKTSIFQTDVIRKRLRDSEEEQTLSGQIINFQHEPGQTFYFQVK